MSAPPHTTAKTNRKLNFRITRSSIIDYNANVSYTSQCHNRSELLTHQKQRRRYLKIGSSQLLCIRIFLDRQVRLDLAAAGESASTKTPNNSKYKTTNVIAQLSRSQTDHLINTIAPDLVQIVLNSSQDLQEIEKDGYKVVVVLKQDSIPKTLLQRQWKLEQSLEGDEEDEQEDKKVGLSASYKKVVQQFECDLFVNRLQ